MKQLEKLQNLRAELDRPFMAEKLVAPSTRDEARICAELEADSIQPGIREKVEDECGEAPFTRQSWDMVDDWYNVHPDGYASVDAWTEHCEAEASQVLAEVRQEIDKFLDSLEEEAKCDRLFEAAYCTFVEAYQAICYPWDDMDLRQSCGNAVTEEDSAEGVLDWIKEVLPQDLEAKLSEEEWADKPEIIGGKPIEELTKADYTRLALEIIERAKGRY